jgi:transposase
MPEHDLGTRLQALTLLEHGVPQATVTTITGISKTQVYALRKAAIQRGYDLVVNKKLFLAYVTDAPRSGRPKKATLEVQEQVAKVVTKNSATRQLTTQQIANTVSNSIESCSISARTVWNILKSLGYSSFKPSYKPDLTKETKALRLAWCLEHKNWTLEDWKNVIWSAETSVTMGGQRGRIMVW